MKTRGAVIFLIDYIKLTAFVNIVPYRPLPKYNLYFNYLIKNKKA